MAFNFFKKKTSTAESIDMKDFSEIDSNEKAVALFSKKKLVKLHLMPLEFGGEDNPLNTLFVPEFVTVFKARFDLMIERLLDEGKDLRYSAQPDYKGSSFIPSKITIKVSGDVSFEEVIEIW